MPRVQHAVGDGEFITIVHPLNALKPKGLGGFGGRLKSAIASARRRVEDTSGNSPDSADSPETESRSAAHANELLAHTETPPDTLDSQTSGKTLARPRGTQTYLNASEEISIHSTASDP